MKNYDHKAIEKKWQEKWEKDGVYKTTDCSDKEKYYVLDMFPYPSGAGLHVGHPKGYIATDVLSRFNRMQGKEVLHPMGWDAFGLPAENYAIKTKTHPRESTEKNIQTFKDQLSILGLDYDWSREINTTDPEYYKWTQWTFIQMFKKGLAYQSDEPINWCPSCKTGLAQEDLEDGKCERCGSEVEKKALPQWVLKITDYADRLLEDIDGLDWPESIKTSQKNWIGKSEGSKISFKVKDSEETIDVFTTRADTLIGVTYVVVAPEHPVLNGLRSQIKNNDEVDAYRAEAQKKNDIERTSEGKEKTGVVLEGVIAEHPITGEELPVWVADYVLASYGTGAVMAVPAHDERDFEFAKKYNLAIKKVITPRLIDHRNPHVAGKEVVSRRGIIAVLHDPANDTYLVLDWKTQDWTTFVVGGVEDGENVVEAAQREILEETGYENVVFKRLLCGPTQAEFFAAHKDLNRIAHTEALFFELQGNERKPVDPEEIAKHTVRWVSKEELTVDMAHVEMKFILEALESGGERMFFDEGGVLTNSGEFNGLTSEEAKQKLTEAAGGEMTTTYKLRDWVFSRQRYWGEPIPIIHCAKCGAVAVPEKDLPVTLPDVESYEPSGTGESPLANISDWVNTTCPECGGEARRETNTMPQWAGSSWYYLRYMDPNNSAALVDDKKEKYWAPVDMYVGGAEHATRHLIYARFWHKFLSDIGVVSTNEPFKKLQHVGLILASDGKKMSKRYGNVINPNDVVENVGADALRVYEMFMGPFDQIISWSEDGVVGPRRFLERVMMLSDFVNVEGGADIDVVLNKTIKKVTDDIQSLNFNTAISSMMQCVNEMDEKRGEFIKAHDFKRFLQILAPFAPHLTEELWEKMGEAESVHQSEWPAYDESKLVSDTVTIAVQVNGKVRDTITISSDADKEAIEKQALESASVQKWLDGKTPSKIIVVPGKIINIVI